MKRIDTLGTVSLAALTSALLALAAPAAAQTAGSNTNNMPGATHQTPMDQSNGYGNGGAATPQSSSMNNASTKAASLSTVQDPKTALASAKVEDSAGQPVGTVAQVNTNKAGKASSIEIALNTPTATGKTAKLKASQLKYDSADNTLKAKLSQSQIEANASSSPATSSPQPGQP